MVFKKVKNTLPWTYVTENLNSEEVVEKFYEKIAKDKQTLELKS